jgi:hypothetical protein
MTQMELVVVKKRMHVQDLQISAGMILYEKGNEDVIDPQIQKLAIHYTQRAKVGDDTWTVLGPHESAIFTYENGRRVSLFFDLHIC